MAGGRQKGDDENESRNSNFGNCPGVDRLLCRQVYRERKKTRCQVHRLSGSRYLRETFFLWGGTAGIVRTGRSSLTAAFVSTLSGRNPKTEWNTEDGTGRVWICLSLFFLENPCHSLKSCLLINSPLELMMQAVEVYACIPHGFSMRRNHEILRKFG